MKGVRNHDMHNSLCGAFVGSLASISRAHVTDDPGRRFLPPDFGNVRDLPVGKVAVEFDAGIIGIGPDHAALVLGRQHSDIHAIPDLYLRTRTQLAAYLTDIVQSGLVEKAVAADADIGGADDVDEPETTEADADEPDTTDAEDGGEEPEDTVEVVQSDGGRLAAVQDAGSLKCGANEALPGFGVVDSAGDYTGFDID